MDLKVTGMALSLQWTPSLRRAEYLLSGRYEPKPSLVEHPGEVVHKALQGLAGKSSSRLFHIQLGHETEFGHYSTLLKEQFQTVESIALKSGQLTMIMQQAANYLSARDRLVVISETTKSGTAAVVLSPTDSAAAGYARVSSWPHQAKQRGQIDYIALASPLDKDNLKQLAAISGADQQDYPTSLGSFNAPRLGQEALPVFIQTVLAIKHKIIPPWFNSLGAPTLEGASQPFIVPAQSRPWLPSGPDFIRRALIAQAAQGEYAWEMLYLEELPHPLQPIEVRSIPRQDPLLFPLTGDQASHLGEEMEKLEDQLEEAGSLRSIALNVYTKYITNKGSLTCCLVARDRESLKKEISHARTGVANALENNQAWISPAGSSFSPQPLGSAEIAFVYPGAFNSYPGMARDLFFAFPGLMEAAREIIPDLRHSLAEEFLYLGGSNQSQFLTEDQLGTEFYDHPDRLIESGISLSVLYTMLLKKVFQLKPDAALGYSLGEISMLWANQVWQNVQDSSESWRQSSLFRDQLVGEMKVVRENWAESMPPDFWTSYILKDTPERVQSACQYENMAYLTIRNTPEEVVIAGERGACQRVIASLGCRSLPMPFNAAIHHPAMESSYPDFLELYSNPTQSCDDIRFYSAASSQELHLSEENLAQTMASMTTSPIDFSSLVERVYRSGVRIFIEVGPQKTCSRWIERILSGKPHAVIPINKKNQPDLQGVLKVLSLLLSQGVDLDLTPLYHKPKTALGASTRSALRSPGTGNSQPERKRAPSVPASAVLNAAYFHNLNRLSQGLIRSHQSYLNEQHTITNQILKLIALRDGLSPSSLEPPPNQNALYTKHQIQAFTVGDPQVCFGDLFQGFQGQRIPRLPNGPLQFIDRVIHVTGQFGKVKPGSALVSEYDLPAQGWFSDRNSGILPHVALMEIALQPCGFLSAYMGSILGRENQDLYFRNLDGEAILLEQPSDLEGPIRTRVELLSSSSLGDVIIQKYRFELFREGRSFFRGSSSFGYFTPQMLKNQQGLDGDNYSSSWHSLHPEAGSWKAFQPTSLPLNGTPGLPSLEHAWVSYQGGNYANGYLFLKQAIPKNSWFYSAHFFQDPVMPGSLGVETMAAALRTAAEEWEIPDDLGWRIAAGNSLKWKYRGQITPKIPEITIDLHIKSITKKGSRWQISADGQLWKGPKRIYLVENLCLESYPIHHES